MININEHFSFIAKIMRLSANNQNSCSFFVLFVRKKLPINCLLCKAFCKCVLVILFLWFAAMKAQTKAAKMFWSYMLSKCYDLSLNPFGVK